MRIKQKISYGIPRHALRSKNGGKKIDIQHLDVEKIMTSDDLMNILEDDYHNEITYTKRDHENDNGNDSEIEYLYDAHPVDINDYLKSIASITYEETYEYGNYINCTV